MSNTSISEFERTKPVVTMKKINELITMIDNEREHTKDLYKQRMNRLDDFALLLRDIKQSFMKGE